MKRTFVLVVAFAGIAFCQNPSQKISQVHCGDSRITGTWVSKDTLVNAKYRFEKSGLADISGNWFYFDSLGLNLGQIWTLGGNFAGSYNIISNSLFVSTAELRIFFNTAGSGYPLVLVREGNSDGEVTVKSGIFGVACQPNPFNASATISLSLPAGKPGMPYSLDIFDSRGRQLRTLAQGQAGSGSHIKKLMWDGRDDQNRILSAGSYIWRLNAGNESRQGKLIRLE